VDDYNSVEFEFLGCWVLVSLISLDQVTLSTVTQRSPQLRRKGVVDHVLLQDVSTVLRSGEIVGVVGATGAGKTSFLRLLNRLVEPLRGKILWQGQAYQTIPVSQLRQQVMLVPQEPKLLGMTVGEAIAYPLILQKLPQQQIDSRLASWRSRLQIPTDWWDKGEVSLSVGQRQWVTIGRGLVCESPVLLLDEPTAHLDGQYAARLGQMVKELSETLVVIASHDLAWLETVCHRVLYFQQGRLVQDVQPEINWGELANRIKATEKAIDDEWG
jgi:D-methionine transport system ATP-binding protein